MLGDGLGGRGTVGLAGAPLLRVRLERSFRGPRVDVLAGDDAGGDFVEPALGVDLAVEVTCVLLAVEVAVAGAPLAVRALLNIRQLSLLLWRSVVVTAALDVVGEGAGVAFLAHEAEALLVDAVRGIGPCPEVVGDGDDGLVKAVLRITGRVERFDGFLDDAPPFEVDAFEVDAFERRRHELFERQLEDAGEAKSLIEGDLAARCAALDTPIAVPAVTPQVSQHAYETATGPKTATRS
jgi:hypothetical protein